MRNALILSLALMATACSAPRDPSGYTPPAEAELVASRAAPQEFARCFQNAATLLPRSLVTREGEAVVYRLAGFGLFFEEIAFLPDGQGGSAAAIRLAPALDAKWRRDFELDRAAAVRRCVT